MRKTITTLAALAALVGGAQSAVAAVPPGDDPAAQFTRYESGRGSVTSCRTPDKPGIAGQYGAWGHYIAGCTVKAGCPVADASEGGPFRACLAKAESRIATERYVGHRVTLNSRLRALRAGSVFWYRDVSSANTDWTRTEDRVQIGVGEEASVQCNGVRQSTDDNRVHVECSLQVEYIK